MLFSGITSVRSLGLGFVPVDGSFWVLSGMGFCRFYPSFRFFFPVGHQSFDCDHCVEIILLLSPVSVCLTENSLCAFFNNNYEFH